MRQIVLDTETTGLDPKEHRVVEIGCIELLDRRISPQHYWQYLNPERDSDPEALRVHGLTTAFLSDKPKFAEQSQRLWDYLAGAELLIHNANFDVGMLNAEFARCGFGRLEEICKITDTVGMARKRFPGARVGLDALCKRFEIDNSHRELHGALLDARLLAEVYLAMTGGQSALSLDTATKAQSQSKLNEIPARWAGVMARKTVVYASEGELGLHQSRLQSIAKTAKHLVWR
jgi:DNA polymerase-3 subunit epsilon